ncbi:hypothetical protein GGI07_000183 [Coemansia sp. Benny D115]|nr:hypothetical protein GGI07_000183 [Coemansia sp. Benny D115]
MMDIEYTGPTRYDYGDSDSETDTASTPAPIQPFVFRLKPLATPPTTLLIDLLPATSKEPYASARKIGTVYAPCTQPQQSPLSGLQANASLSHIVESSPGVVRVLASNQVPLDLQHRWAETVIGRLNPKRVVLVDRLEVAGEFRSPAVLASQVIVGLAAAVLNYADIRGIACVHVRGKGSVRDEDLDTLFGEYKAAAAAAAASEQDSCNIKHETSTSLYL